MNKQPNVSLKIVTFVALLLCVVGCASTSTPSLIGTWVTTVTEAEAPTFAGQGEITFAENGRYSVLQVGMGVTTEGSYTITQDQIVMTDDRGVCVKVGFPKGTYKWSVEKDALTFTLIDDGCYNRRKLVDGRTLSRKK